MALWDQQPFRGEKSYGYAASIARDAKNLMKEYELSFEQAILCIEMGQRELDGDFKDEQFVGATKEWIEIINSGFYQLAGAINEQRHHHYVKLEKTKELD